MTTNFFYWGKKNTRIHTAYGDSDCSTNRTDQRSRKLFFWTHTHTNRLFTQAQRYKDAQICVHTRVYINTYMHIHTHMRAGTHKRKGLHVHPHTHTLIHTHVQPVTNSHSCPCLSLSYTHTANFPASLCLSLFREVRLGVLNRPKIEPFLWIPEFSKVAWIISSS